MTITERAKKAAMRAIPMVGDGEAYRQRLADFQRGYRAGNAAATRRASKVAIAALLDPASTGK